MTTPEEIHRIEDFFRNIPPDVPKHGVFSSAAYSSWDIGKNRREEILTAIQIVERVKEVMDNWNMMTITLSSFYDILPTPDPIKEMQNMSKSEKEDTPHFFANLAIRHFLTLSRSYYDSLDKIKEHFEDGEIYEAILAITKARDIGDEQNLDIAVLTELRNCAQHDFSPISTIHWDGNAALSCPISTERLFSSSRKKVKDNLLSKLTEDKIDILALIDRAMHVMSINHTALQNVVIQAIERVKEIIEALIDEYREACHKEFPEIAIYLLPEPRLRSLQNPEIPILVTTELCDMTLEAILKSEDIQSKNGETNSKETKDARKEILSNIHWKANISNGMKGVSFTTGIAYMALPGYPDIELDGNITKTWQLFVGLPEDGYGLLIPFNEVMNRLDPTFPVGFDAYVPWPIMLDMICAIELQIPLRRP